MQSSHFTRSSSCQPFEMVSLQFKAKRNLTQAIAQGDPAVIHPFLAEIGKDRRKSVDGDIDTGAAALHLAVRCGSGRRFKTI